MTPKEKAMDVAMKFDKQGETDNAKQCALICAEQMIEECEGYPKGIKYWKDVKQEINKL